MRLIIIQMLPILGEMLISIKCPLKHSAKRKKTKLFAVEVKNENRLAPLFTCKAIKRCGREKLTH